jgi:hypothetical protein
LLSLYRAKWECGFDFNEQRQPMITGIAFRAGYFIPKCAHEAGSCEISVLELQLSEARTGEEQYFNNIIVLQLL